MYERGTRKWLTFGLFLGPSLAGVVLFLVGPILASLGLSFVRWDLLTAPQWAGLRNYRELAIDPEFWTALRHTLTFLGGYIPLVMTLGLLVALALNGRVPARNAFRAVYFLPVVMSWVAVALVWRWLLNPYYGLLNNLLRAIGIQGPAWLFEPTWAMVSVILTSVWKDTGFVMVILLAGLQAIPTVYHEAAEIDGATPAQRVRHITLPLLAPAFFFALSISLINSFQVFDQVYVLTGGGPAGATTVLVERIVKNAFSFSRMGYASAMSWVLFALIFAVTLAFSRVQRRRL